MNEQISDGAGLQFEARLGIDLVIQSERFTKSAKHTFAVLNDDIGILCGAWMAMNSMVFRNARAGIVVLVLVLSATVLVLVIEC